MKKYFPSTITLVIVILSIISLVGLYDTPAPPVTDWMNFTVHGIECGGYVYFAILILAIIVLLKGVDIYDTWRNS